MTESIQVGNYELASIRSRLIAGIIDGIIMMIIFELGLRFIVNWNPRAVISEGTFMGFSKSGIIVMATIIFIHFAVNYSSLCDGKTIGMMIVNIQAADVHGNVAPIWRMYFLREVIYWGIVSVLEDTAAYFIYNYHMLNYRELMLLVRIISAAQLLLIFRSDRRCLHDFFAGTIVIKTRGFVSNQLPPLPQWLKRIMRRAD